MKKAWITYTIASLIFFIICFTIVIFFNKPALSHYWEEALLIVSILNLVVAFIYYKRNKNEIASGRKMTGDKNVLNESQGKTHDT